MWHRYYCSFGTRIPTWAVTYALAMRKWTKNTWRRARGRNMKGGGWTCWAGKESWTSGGGWHQDSKTSRNQNQNLLLQPMRFVNRGLYMIPSICSEICWFSRYYNKQKTIHGCVLPVLHCLLLVLRPSRVSPGLVLQGLHTDQPWNQGSDPGNTRESSDSNRVPCPVPCPGLTCPGCGTGLTCPGPVPGPVPAPASDSSRGSFSSLKIIIWNGDGGSWKGIIKSLTHFKIIVHHKQYLCLHKVLPCRMK